MSKTVFKAVIGKNFGDEGKGLATDFLCLSGAKNLVVRANGGAQSGHTVETGTKRFVFHELSSGSFRHADTYWASTYHPDLYKLAEEIEEFRAVGGFVPRVYASENTGITTILDVILNMAFETARGVGRHGSCGMGIYECELREQAGYKITVGDVIKLEVEGLIHKLLEIRENYVPKRLKEEGLALESLGEYTQLLRDDNIVMNYAKIVHNNLKWVETVESEKDFFNEYDQVIFENGQGLLLDSECKRFYPNVTGSRTGLANIALILNNVGEKLDEVLYVSRSYVTRHGAGELPCECKASDIPGMITDVTNRPNEWQGKLRFGFHESVEEFVRPVEEDIKTLDYRPKLSLLLTHLNETDGYVMIMGRKIVVRDFWIEKAINDVFDKLLYSQTIASADVRQM
ncbi:MAG: adenylosuccinate synthetase [Lachnospiraceae bacterium]|nr:adenylosuccinate synthetase [Lachnospiraceae bacterium]